jgi:hypothetical protein
MPETPDFDQIAYAAVRDPSGHVEVARIKPVAAALRQVWNARGAADLALINRDTLRVSSAQGRIRTAFELDLLDALQMLDR